MCQFSSQAYARTAVIPPLLLRAHGVAITCALRAAGHTGVSVLEAGVRVVLWRVSSLASFATSRYVTLVEECTHACKTASSRIHQGDH